MPAAWPSAPVPAPAPSARPAGSFAAGFQSAVAKELRRIFSGAVEPEPEDFLGAFCGEAFDPAVSRDPHFCGPCAEEGAYK